MNNENNKKRSRIVFLDILTGDTELRKKLDRDIHFDKKYSDLIKRIIKTPIFSFNLVDASLGKFPRFNEFDCLIIGGSVEDPISGKEKKWMKEVYSFIKEAVIQKKPILGICGGLQFTIKALGGQIVNNPKGREFGTIKITVNREGRKDKLFQNMPSSFFAQSSHKCVAVNLRNNWKIIATSSMCGVQAVSIGENIRLIQFHPEMTVDSMRALAKMRKQAFEKEGIIKKGNFKKFLKSIRQTKKATILIDNFIRHFVIGN